jgi:hypothetical protein
MKLKPVLTREEARRFADEWIDAWNSHDLGRIVEHYSGDIEFSSPFIKGIGVDASGCLRGRESLLAYFAAALSKFPDLHFEFRAVFCGVEALTVLYESVNDLLAAETFVLSDAGKIKRVWAQYDKPPFNLAS